MLFFADSNEGPVTQAMLMGSVTSVITILLLLLVFFNQPFQDDVGGLQPESMERALRIIDNDIVSERLTVDPALRRDGCGPGRWLTARVAVGRPSGWSWPGHGAAGHGRGGDGVEQLPGHPLER